MSHGVRDRQFAPRTASRGTLSVSLPGRISTENSFREGGICQLRCSPAARRTGTARCCPTRMLSKVAAGSKTRTYQDRKSTRLNSSHTVISYAVFCLKKKKKQQRNRNVIGKIHHTA